MTEPPASGLSRVAARLDDLRWRARRALESVRGTEVPLVDYRSASPG